MEINLPPSSPSDPLENSPWPKAAKETLEDLREVFAKTEEFILEIIGLRNADVLSPQDSADVIKKYAEGAVDVKWAEAETIFKQSHVPDEDIKTLKDLKEKLDKTLTLQPPGYELPRKWEDDYADLMDKIDTLLVEN